MAGPRVRRVVETHLDLDHVGGLSDSHSARVHVHTALVSYSVEGQPWFDFEKKVVSTDYGLRCRNPASASLRSA